MFKDSFEGQTNYDTEAEIKARVEEKIKRNIGLLRQWLNEKPSDQLVSNSDIEYILFNEKK